MRAHFCCLPAVIGILLFITPAIPDISEQTAHTLTGNFQFHRQWHSRFLATDRDIIIYLPPGYYENKRKRYQVLYLQDGQNLFDGATSYIPGMEWHVDETAEELIRLGEVAPLIIVGIYNAGLERVNEYTPVFEPKFQAGGMADLYGRMLVEELKPFVDSRYRTMKDPQNTGLGGSSLGGLVSLHLGLRYPRVFGKLAVMSPSVWWGGNAIVREVSVLPRKVPVTIWLDTGTKESARGEAAENVRLLRDALLAKGWELDKDLRYFEALGAVHNEEAWSRRVGPILEYLFPGDLKAASNGRL